MSTPNPLQAAPAAIPANPQEARAQLDAHKLARVNGTFVGTDAEWFERSEYLARLVQGEQVAPPPAAPLTMQDKLDAQYDELMKPPALGERYNFAPPPPGDTTPPEEIADVQVKAAEALRAAGIPTHLGGPIYDGIDAMARRFADASESDIQTQLSVTQGQLSTLWGEQAKARIDAITEFLVVKSQGSRLLADILDHMPFTIYGNSAVMEYLDRVVQHRLKTRR
jgi:hypothetical protein